MVEKTSVESFDRMSKIAIIIPYIGALPNYFPLWLQSCKNNPTIDWLLYTDQELYDLPENVICKKVSFSQLRERFQKNFDFSISLNVPYKFCDFKPSFGEIFEDDLKGYDFWGYGDIDLIYGDIREFVTEELLFQYDRIFTLGHLSLFRNCKDINAIYRKKVEGCLFYRDVFSTAKSLTFDEFGQNSAGGCVQIFQNSGVRIYNRIVFADISTTYRALKSHFGGPKAERNKEYRKRKVSFFYDSGKLFQTWQEKKTRLRKEVLYIHLQKRKMKNHCVKTDSFYIYPYDFCNEPKKHFFTMGLSMYFIKFAVSKLFRK